MHRKPPSTRRRVVLILASALLLIAAGGTSYALAVGRSAGPAATGTNPLADATPQQPSRTPAPTRASAPRPAAVVPPDACVVQADLRAAVDYASDHGEKAAVAVLDTATDTYFSDGDDDAEFNTASVVKVFIATNLLLTGKMNGHTADTAYRMVTQSDDDAANALYGLAGGDDVEPIVEKHYDVDDLGSPPAQAGKWGETKITASGMSHLYAALKKDPKVWPWLSKAMNTATRHGADGTDQYFGIPSASDDWKVKQGWMVGLGPGSTYNTTGFVQDDRYIVVILSYGPAGQYGKGMPATLTAMAKYVLPGGTVGGASPTSAKC